MKTHCITFVALLFTVFALQAQQVSTKNKKSEKPLLVVGNIEVTADEFKHVYLKNLELVQDASQNELERYLDLFINYKLKVATAYTEGLHEKTTYLDELNSYEDQLARSYIYESRVLETAALEAYNRSLEELDVSHLLIKTTYNNKPTDTLAAFKKIQDLRAKALAGVSFDSLIRTYSEEPEAATRGGKLGYFSAFDMVMPFEEVAYNTPTDSISKVVRTRFGYHILKVHDRRLRAPKINAAHIMVSTSTGKRTFDPATRIQEVYSLLENGADFGEMAKQYSDDKGSGKKGGVLRPFRRGELRSKIFENMVFSLDSGQYSKPFKTEFGWHIVKRFGEEAIPTYEDVKPEFLKKVQQGNRLKKVTSTINAGIKTKYNFKKGAAWLPFFETFVGDSILKRKWQFKPLTEADNKVLFSLQDTLITFNDFAKYVAEKQTTERLSPSKTRFLQLLYEQFETETLHRLYRKILEAQNTSYSAALREYKEGLLIFEIMQQKVWKASQKDTIGLAAFYEANKDNYQWHTRYVLSSARTQSQEAYTKITEWFNAKKDSKTIDSLIKSSNTPLVFTRDTLEVGVQTKIKNLAERKKGEVFDGETQSGFQLFRVEAILAPSYKPKEKIQGPLISAYQEFYEAKWLKALREKYPVVVNKKQFKKLKKQLQKQLQN